MKRSDLVKQIETLDETITLRTDIVHVLAQQTHLTLKKVPPVWLIGVGAVTGALTAIVTPDRFYAMGLTGSRLLPLTRKAFSVGQQFGAGE